MSPEEGAERYRQDLIVLIQMLWGGETGIHTWNNTLARARGIAEAVAAEKEKNKKLLIQIGKLCIWGLWPDRQSHSEDMRKIRELVEEATGMSFEEYT